AGQRQFQGAPGAGVGAPQRLAQPSAVVGEPGGEELRRRLRRRGAGLEADRSAKALEEVADGEDGELLQDGHERGPWWRGRSLQTDGRAAGEVPSEEVNGGTLAVYPRRNDRGRRKHAHATRPGGSTTGPAFHVHSRTCARMDWGQARALSST